MIVAACLPYLLLSVFVDFVHLHPLLGGAVTQLSAVPHVAACTPPASRTGDSPCAICQWLRAGTGLQPSIAISPAIGMLAGTVTLPAAPPRGSPAPLSVDLRGPPSVRCS